MTPRHSRRGQRGLRTGRLRRGRRWPAVALVAGLLGTGIAAAGVEPSLALWRDTEVGTPALKAGTVLPAASLVCETGIGQVTFRWTLPNGGLTRANWSWRYQAPLGPVVGNPAAGATSTTMVVVLGINQPFTLWAVGPSGWTSKVWTARVTMVVGGLSCVVSPAPT